MRVCGRRETERRERRAESAAAENQAPPAPGGAQPMAAGGLPGVMARDPRLNAIFAWDWR